MSREVLATSHCPDTSAPREAHTAPFEVRLEHDLENVVRRVELGQLWLAHTARVEASAMYAAEPRPSNAPAATAAERAVSKNVKRVTASASCLLRRELWQLPALQLCLVPGRCAPIKLFLATLLVIAPVGVGATDHGVTASDLLDCPAAVGAASTMSGFPALISLQLLMSFQALTQGARLCLESLALLGTALVLVPPTGDPLQPAPAHALYFGAIRMVMVRRLPAVRAERRGATSAFVRAPITPGHHNRVPALRVGAADHDLRPLGRPGAAGGGGAAAAAARAAAEGGAA
mmetsp:Transcript_65559/g.191878  ORF Transcript_65559/g.191878 Transcript_65559/m.191878 type:complete len:290 (-) Transcript_65559:800-1669(-)